MNFFKKIGSFLSSGFLREATGLIDKLVTTKAEREQLRQAMQSLVQKHQTDLIRLANEDRASARDMQKAALAQEDPFSKRFVYYLAALWSVAGIIYIFLVTFTSVVNARIADTVMGFLMGTIVSTIINYFFGSSDTKPTEQLTGSKEHEDHAK